MHNACWNRRRRLRKPRFWTSWMNCARMTREFYPAIHCRVCSFITMLFPSCLSIVDYLRRMDQDRNVTSRIKLSRHSSTVIQEVQNLGLRRRRRLFQQALCINSPCTGIGISHLDHCVRRLQCSDRTAQFAQQTHHSNQFRN